jgi:hypothetical protein
VSARQPYRLHERTPLVAAQTFTPAELRSLVADAAGRRYAPLADAAAERLGGILSQHHAWFHAAQEERRLNDMIAEARAAVDTLARIVPQIRDVLRDRNAAAGGWDWFLARRLKDAERAAAFAELPTNWQFLAANSLPDSVRDWRWLAKTLPGDIETAMRPTNPDFRAGISEDGPLLRILEVIIPLISGESPTRAAIKSQLVAVRRVAEPS